VKGVEPHGNVLKSCHRLLRISIRSRQSSGGPTPIGGIEQAADIVPKKWPQVALQGQMSVDDSKLVC
jgi:hypothetical protein